MKKFQKAGWKCICLSQTLQISWMFCGTNLAAKTSWHVNNWWWKGNTSLAIATRGCSHVELMTKNKALPEDSPNYYLFISLHDIFWLLTISGEDQKERRTSNTYEHESCTDYNILISHDGRTTTEGDFNSTHLKFCCLAMQTPSVVGGMWIPWSKFLSFQSISYFGFGVSSCILLYK